MGLGCGLGMVVGATGYESGVWDVPDRGAVPYALGMADPDSGVP